MYAFVCLQMSGRMSLSLEEFEQENYDFEDLEAIANDKNKVEFLRVLAISAELIEWLRRETKGTYGFSIMHILHTYCMILFLQMLQNYIIWLGCHCLKIMSIKWIASLSFTLLGQP